MYKPNWRSVFREDVLEESTCLVKRDKGRMYIWRRPCLCKCDGGRSVSLACSCLQSLVRSLLLLFGINNLVAVLTTLRSV